jgi:TatD DNase family protein
MADMEHAGLIDTHCHLTNPGLAGRVGDVLARAAAGGVGRVICSASDLADSAAAAEIAGANAAVWATAGVHPHEAKDAGPNLAAELERLCGLAKAVAIGEIGLDYHYDFSPRDAQRRVFAEQLALARKLGKPVAIHTREAFEDTLAVLKESGIAGNRVAFHSFTEGPGQARRALEFGATLGFSGILTFKNAAALRESAALAPADRIMVETDAPYLSPEPVRQMKVNEPCNVAHVAACLAAIRGVSPQHIAELTTANAERFFGLTSA